MVTVANIVNELNATKLYTIDGEMVNFTLCIFYHHTKIINERKRTKILLKYPFELQFKKKNSGIQ